LIRQSASKACGFTLNPIAWHSTSQCRKGAKEAENQPLKLLKLRSKMKLYDYKAEELQQQIDFLKILMIAPLAITFIFSIIIYLIKFF